jgi:hypothetical protein
MLKKNLKKWFDLFFIENIILHSIDSKMYNLDFLNPNRHLLRLDLDSVDLANRHFFFSKAL